MSEIEVTRRGAVLEVAFARPARKNALTHAMYEALAEAVRSGEKDEAVRAILFHGSQEAFTAGNDIADFIERPPGGTEAPVFQFISAVLAGSKPLVAAVNGPAIGIGTTLLMHCDLVYAGDNARFGLPFTALGLLPEFGSSFLLPLIAGYHRAAELLLLGEPFGPEQALAAGIVTRVVPAAETLETARAAAGKLCALPSKSVRLTRSLLRESHRDALIARTRVEAEHFREMLNEGPAREALRAFIEKRKPDFGNQ